MEENIPQIFPQTSNKNALIISCNDYKRLFSGNLKHDSYFNVKGLLKCGNEFNREHLTLEMITKKDRQTVMIQYPYPIGDTKCYLKDFCSDLMVKKLRYINEYNHYVKLHKNNNKNVVDEYMNLPKYVINLVEDKIKDPDCYLKTNYNYYYTGGNLDQLLISNNKKYFVQAIEGSTLGFVNMSDPNDRTLFNLHDLIYGIKAYNINNDAFVLVRHKKMLTLYEVDAKCGIAIEKIWKHKSNAVPFIDCKLNPYVKDTILSLKSNSYLVLSNVENKKNTPTKLDDDYFQFDFMNDTLIFAISTNNMVIYDTRSNTEKTSKEIETGVLKCDYFSTFTFTADNENYVYVLSTHNIKKIDLRTFSSVTSCPHLLTQPPLICKFFNLNGRETIFASGTNYNERILYVEDYIPQRVPNLLETYQESCLRNGPVIKKGIEERIKLSTTGLAVSLGDKGCQLYTSNSIGELFCNEVSYEMLNNEKSSHILWDWMKEVKEIDEPLKINDMRSMRKIKCMLTNTFDDNRLERYIRENEKLKDFYKLKVVDNNMNLKEIWEEEDDDEDDDAISPNEKVQNWLQNTMELDD